MKPCQSYESSSNSCTSAASVAVQKSALLPPLVPRADCAAQRCELGNRDTRASALIEGNLVDFEWTTGDARLAVSQRKPMQEFTREL
jgi:hypothetical protein